MKKFDDKDKILIESGISGSVSVDIPNLRFSRKWRKKGSVEPVKMEILRDAIYDEGFKYMLDEGILIIKDRDVLIDLEMISEEEKETEHLAVLTEQEIKRYLTVMPFAEMKGKIEILPKTQVEEVVTYAIQNKIYGGEKISYLEEISGKKIKEAIRLNEANEGLDE